MFQMKFILVISLVFVSVFGIKNRQVDQVIAGVRLKIDKPIRSDLISYLRSLHYLINFYANDKNDIDMNVEFGIFLVNVHLKSAVRQKGHSLPKSILDNIQLLIQNVDKLTSFFNTMLRRDKKLEDRPHIILTTLFNNESVWMSQIQKFNTLQFKMPKIHSLQDLKKTCSDFEQYKKDVIDITKFHPTPHQSDACLVELGKNPVHIGNEFKKCDVPDDCIGILYNGTDNGYFLTHRILLLLAARFGRRCSIISPEKDKKIIEKLCGYAYKEAEYISKNEYALLDLMMEQIIFCLLDGHLEFLRRSWLTTILTFQTAEGCFGIKPNALDRVNPMREFKRTKWQLNSEGNHDIMGGRCNSHIATVAAATIATAVRYILETYY